MLLRALQTGFVKFKLRSKRCGASSKSTTTKRNLPLSTLMQRFFTLIWRLASWRRQTIRQISLNGIKREDSHDFKWIMIILDQQFSVFFLVANENVCQSSKLRLNEGSFYTDPGFRSDSIWLKDRIGSPLDRIGSDRVGNSASPSSAVSRFTIIDLPNTYNSHY